MPALFAAQAAAVCHHIFVNIFIANCRHCIADTQLIESLVQTEVGHNGSYDRISQQMNECYYQGFTDAEIQQLEGFLQRILDNLEGEKNRE